MSEVGERIKGGAVKEDKSPENDAILINVRDECEWGTRCEIEKGPERTISGRRSRIHVELLERPKCARGRGGAELEGEI